MAIKAASQVTILDVTDAYAAYLTCYTYSWTGDQTGIAAGNSCVTEAYGYQGSARVQKVSVNVADIVCPAGISATVENNGTTQVKITFQTTEKITSTCEALVPVVLNDDVTMNLKFVFAVSKQGPNGTSVTVSSTSVTYQVGNSGTEKPTGTWEEDVPTAGTGQYLWTKTVVQYSD